MEARSRCLAWHGALLLLIGMLTGLVEAQFANVRMGLAAHLEGVMNGILLLALAAAWQRLRLGARAERTTFGLLLYGTYANWGFTTLSAVWGTVGLSPVTAEKLIAAGQSAAPWQENLVLGGFVSVGVAMLAATVTILWGLRGRGAA
jgi:hydroxylaminobenzene mutase